MTLSRVRRIGRAFAVALLLWTAADLLDYGLCENSHSHVGAHARTTLEAPDSHDSCSHSRCHDCFCCSPYVDVKTPFVIDLAEHASRTVPPDPLLLVPVTTARLYHPPLA